MREEDFADVVVLRDEPVALVREAEAVVFFGEDVAAFLAALAFFFGVVRLLTTMRSSM